MTSLKDLDRIIPDVIAQLEKIASDMSSYKKIKTDLRATALINEIKEKVKQIKLAYETYKRPDLSHLYANYNFDDYVKAITGYVPEYRAVYERIKKFENITDYYDAGKPFVESRQEEKMVASSNSVNMQEKMDSSELERQ